MRIEIVNTGTELLLGKVLNTHGAWIGRALFPLGLRVARQTAVPDGDIIGEVMGEAMARADVLIVTGGLGPTSDDITREATAGLLGVDLVEDRSARKSLEEFFAKRGRPMAEANLKQAQVPRGGEVLPNPNGTAPGVYMPPGVGGRWNCAVFLLPGPPREMEPMFAAEVMPRLRALAGGMPEPDMLEMKFTGIGESDLHQSVDAKLAKVAGLEVGYCARLGEVDVRLIGTAKVIAEGRRIVLGEFAINLVSEDGAELEEVVIREMKKRGWKLAVAESCTGGLICSRLTDVPGSSEVLTYGYITYANAAKISLLGVSPEDIENHGAVSEAVARQMAEGALRASGADIAVSVTGIAGPTGGSREKPVGTVWIAVAGNGRETVAKKFFHPRERISFKRTVSQLALDEVRRMVAGG